MSPVHRRDVLIPVLMNVLLVVAVVLVARIVVDFFGILAATGSGSALLRWTDLIVPQLGFEPLRTPYGGVFDREAALMVGLLLIAEWVLALGRSRG